MEMESGIYGPAREKFFMELGLKSRKEFNKAAQEGLGKKAGFYAAYTKGGGWDLDLILAGNDMHINALIAELEDEKPKQLDDILTPEIEIYLFKHLIKGKEIVSYNKSEFRFEEIEDED